ncbi:hypothetical protein [Flagellimonas marina]|uniref:Cytochrome c domain-containing protein n=1 Tax=Flagellimonas marina TaxID=1775168 RepID=A0ABV8PIQ2_9FLAO
MKILKFISISCLLFLLQSCAYDSEDDLIAIEENDGEDDSENPDGPGITYVNTIKAIMDSNCVSCHSSPPRNGAPFALVNYNQVSGRANGILNAMARESGSPGAMPPAGTLPQNTINQIQEWIDNGTPEN